ncbi:CHAT domain-containing protein [Aspergillus bertholletiae]|uniref:CHAT domain-containing protein n=1 Tax=Aspergillus bertholletiae TaxID=1226010 RepID=A0A5N7BHA9_9EURO|nr:CHAT domain-containing protein [Aspergillus bertholletiae]
MNVGACDNSSLAFLLSRRGRESLLQYRESGDPAHLDESIDFARQALHASLPAERATYLNSLGCRLRERFEALGKIQDISEAIQVTEDASLAIHDPTEQMLVLANLATYLGDRFESREDMGDLERAIMAGQDALRISSSDQGSQAICLTTLSILHGYRFSKLGALDDLETATRMGEQAVELISPNHPDRAMYLNDLSACYERRFERLGDPTDIDKAINCSSEAVGLSRDDFDRGLHLKNLSNALGSRFLIKGDAQDLSDAITYVNEAIQCTPENHQRYPFLLHDLSFHLEDRFRRYNNITDLEKAISLEEDAISRVDPEDPRLLMLWDELAVLLSLRCDLNDDIGLLDRAIELAEKALDSTTDDNRDRAQYLAHMAAFLASRFERTGSLNDLEQSILLGRQAVDIIPNDDPHRVDLLLDLSDYLHNRYIRLGSPEDNRQAVEIIQTAMQSQTKYASLRPSQLCTLSHRFRDRYESTKEKADIDQSIQLAQEALNRVPLDHPQRAYCLHSLSSALEKRFLVLGTMSDLEKSIEYSEKALESTSPDRSDRIDYLYALSIKLTSRYELLGGLIDLEEAIHLMQSCIESEPPNYLNRVSHLKTLSDQLGYLFERNMHTGTLDRAIDTATEAMKLIPKDDMMGSSILNSLHLLFISRFKTTNNLSDLKSAIEAQREAIKRDSHYRGDRSILIHNLSVGLALYQHTGEPTDPTEAIKLSWEAVETASEYHPNRAMYLNTCGTFLKENYELTTQIIPGDKKPKDLFLEAFRHESSPPLDRIKAGENAFDCYISNGEWTQANSVARDVVKLFPLLVPRWLSQDDQQHLLKNISHFTSRAASAVLQANGPPLDALKILETGRGVIARCSIGLKTDISKLEKSHPSLHDEYTMLRRQLSLPSFSTFSSAAEPSQPTLICRRRKAPGLLPPHITTTGPERAEILRRIEHLEEKIRTFPGFEDFNQAPSHASYAEFAMFGPVVVFNVTEQRSDAIIVAENDIYGLHLEQLRFQDLKANVARVIGYKRLSKGVPTTRPQRNRELQDILHWLWATAVHPVLTRIGLYSDKPRSVLPRVWWVASGYMGLLPLHAAGDATRRTMDYVISSYIPTFQVLQFCRERRRMSFREHEPKMLLVSAPEKLDRQTLKTNVELESIREGLQGHQVSYTMLDRPSRDDVLRELPEHHLLHFSCHGYSNATDPSKSALELACTAEDGATSQLTVRDLSLIGHEKAQIAYLSACSTAENSSDELLDEVIHIASAFQLIGFPHVVGTLWEVSDRAAVEVSRLFYEQLGRQMCNGDESNIACCLHEALQTYRKSRKVSRTNDVLSWAPFIYMGA